MFQEKGKEKNRGMLGAPGCVGPTCGSVLLAEKVGVREAAEVQGEAGEMDRYQVMTTRLKHWHSGL